MTSPTAPAAPTAAPSLAYNPSADAGILPLQAGDLVRLALGLPDSALSAGDPLAGVMVRTDLHLDGYQASEETRLTEIFADRDARTAEPATQERSRPGARTVG